MEGLKVPSPEWLHRTVSIEIGKNHWQFRTLSMYDVWKLWPYFSRVAEAVTLKRPVTYAQETMKILDHVCMGFTQSEDFKKLKPVHVTALIEFYSAQDWAKIKTLGEATNPKDKAEADAMDAEQADYNFYKLCSIGAAAASMSVVEFVDQRFEFCVDALNSARKQIRDAQKDVTMSNAIGFAALVNSTPAIKVDEESKPGWMKEIEERCRAKTM